MQYSSHFRRSILRRTKQNKQLCSNLRVGEQPCLGPKVAAVSPGRRRERRKKLAAGRTRWRDKREGGRERERDEGREEENGTGELGLGLNEQRQPRSPASLSLSLSLSSPTLPLHRLPGIKQTKFIVVKLTSVISTFDSLR